MICGTVDAHYNHIAVSHSMHITTHIGFQCKFGRVRDAGDERCCRDFLVAMAIFSGGYGSSGFEATGWRPAVCRHRRSRSFPLLTPFPLLTALSFCTLPPSLTYQPKVPRYSWFVRSTFSRQAAAPGVRRGNGLTIGYQIDSLLSYHTRAWGSCQFDLIKIAMKS